MDAVGAIDVGVPGRAEHRGVAWRAAAVGVRGGVVLLVGLELDDDPSDAVDEELGSDQRDRDLVHVAREELGPQTRAGAALRRALRTRGRGRCAEQATCPTAEIDDVEAALLGRVGDALGEVERAVEHAGLTRRAGPHRGEDRALGARGDDRLGDPLDPDARAGAMAALPARKRLERVDLVAARVLAEAEEDHAGRAVAHAAMLNPQAAVACRYRALPAQALASAAASASTTRSCSSRPRRAWKGSAIVRALASSLTGQRPSEKPKRSRM